MHIFDLHTISSHKDNRVHSTYMNIPMRLEIFQSIFVTTQVPKRQGEADLQKPRPVQPAGNAPVCASWINNCGCDKTKLLPHRCERFRRSFAALSPCADPARQG